MTRNQSIVGELQRIEGDGLARRLHALPHVGGKMTVDGRTLLNFSSNDYLNLANDPRLKRAAQAAIDRYGCGATSSRLMAGHLDIHAELEAALARLSGLDAALVFPSGYQANLGVLTSLARDGDVIFSDALNHASIIDGCRLSRATVRVYRHRDTNHLEELLRRESAPGRRVIVSDAVFSMDGDLAPLEALRALADRYDAFLVVDEAHSLGIYGEGAGLCAECGVRPDVLTANLAKALGGGGGFVAASRELVDLFINRARSFIFSTGLAPACVGAAIEAIRIVESEPHLGVELLRRAEAFRTRLAEIGIDVPRDRSPIVPVVIGTNEAAVSLSDALADQDVLVSAIRPPSVPENTARLRFSLTLAHDEETLSKSAQALSLLVTTA